MHRTYHIRPRLMHGGVNREARWVDGVHIALRLHDAFFVYETEVFGTHVPERARERVDPEFIGVDWVAHCDVSAGAFVVVAIGTYVERVSMRKAVIERTSLKCKSPEIAIPSHRRQAAICNFLKFLSSIGFSNVGMRTCFTTSTWLPLIGWAP